jgi:hypothetical protein
MNSRKTEKQKREESEAQEIRLSLLLFQVDQTR